MQQTKVFSEAQREEEKSLGVLTSLETLYYFIFIHIYICIIINYVLIFSHFLLNWVALISPPLVGVWNTKAFYMQHLNVWKKRIQSSFGATVETFCIHFLPSSFFGLVRNMSPLNASLAVEQSAVFFVKAELINWTLWSRHLGSSCKKQAGDTE